MINTIDWRNQIKLEDLPEIYQDIAEYIGIAAALELGEKMGGEDFYLPKVDSVLARHRNKLIKADLAAGLSYKQIARKYGITERWVRVIEQGKDSTRSRRTD
jgi:Mor family transcriptional regulator